MKKYLPVLGGVELGKGVEGIDEGEGELDGERVGESQLNPPEGCESATSVAAQLEAWEVRGQVEET